MIAASPNVPSDTELSCLTPFRDLGEQRIRQQRRLTILSFRGRYRRIWSPAGRLFRCGYLDLGASESEPCQNHKTPYRRRPSAGRDLFVGGPSTGSGRTGVGGGTGPSYRRNLSSCRRVRATDARRSRSWRVLTQRDPDLVGTCRIASRSTVVARMLGGTCSWAGL